MTCPHCDETIEPDDRTVPIVMIAAEGVMRRGALHWECSMRAVIGSAAHVEGRCACVVPGSTEGDAPGLTRREAAVAAVIAWRRAQGELPS